MREIYEIYPYIEFHIKPKLVDSDIKIFSEEYIYLAVQPY